MSKERTTCAQCTGRANRECPAVSSSICSICCAKERNSVLACPPTCVHNSFGTTDYDKWLAVELKWTQRCHDRINTAIPPREFADILVNMGVTDKDDSDYLKWAAAMIYALNHRVGPRGIPQVDEWEQERAAHMGGDDCILFRTWRAAMPAIIEVQHVKDSKTTECVDLLDATRRSFCIVDRSLAGASNRFDRYLTWLWHLPHFSRPLGSTIRLEPRAFDALLPRLCDEAGDNPAQPGMRLRQYLLGNLGDAMDILADIHEELRERMLSSLDIVQTIAHYNLLKPMPDIEAVLDAREDFAPDEPGDGSEYPRETLFYVWLRKGESKAFEDTAPRHMRLDGKDGHVGILGRLRLLPGKLEVETMGSLTAAYAKEHIVRILGGMIAPQAVERKDMAQQLREQAGGDNTPRASRKQTEDDGIPADVRQKMMEEFYRNHYRTFMDDAVPALGGMTPREAAKKPAARPKLVSLMKEHISSFERLQKKQNITLSMDWVLKELGLHELL